MANDENLCAGLVQQNDTSDMCGNANNMSNRNMLPTQQPNIEDSINNSSSISNQPEDKDSTQNMKCCPNNPSSSNDALAVAFSVLERA